MVYDRLGVAESFNGRDSIERSHDILHPSTSQKSVHTVRQSPLFESLVIPEGL